MSKKRRYKTRSKTLTIPLNNANDSFQQRFQRAIILLEENNLAEATTLLTELLKENPADPAGVLELLAVASERLEKPDAALNFYKAARERNPGRTILNLSIANVYIKQDRFDDAVDLLKDTLGTSQKDLTEKDAAAGYSMLGTVYMYKGEKDKAKHNLKGMRHGSRARRIFV